MFSDELGLFEGLSGFIGEFTEFELSRGPRTATALTTAGREAGEPAFVAYELGDGSCCARERPQWSRELDESALSLEVPQVTMRIWRLLAAEPAAA